MGEVQPGELDLAAVEDPEVLQEPVVEGTMNLVLHAAQRVGDTLDGVGEGVLEIVHGIDAPRVPGPMMRGVADAVHHRVAHVQVRVSHVDLRPQGARPVGELPGPHAAEQGEVLVDPAVAERAVAPGWSDGDRPLVGDIRAPVFADLLLVEITHVCLAGADELLGPLVELLEITGGEELALAPVEPQPADVRRDGLDVFLFFFLGVGVVESEIAHSAELRGDAEIQADGLGVADVKVAIGLGRPACAHVREPAAGEVLFHGIADEVRGHTRCGRWA